MTGTKLLSGMLRACEKRPVSLNQLEQAIDEIEQSCQNSLVREVSSQKLGEYALAKLREVDKSPMCRFAIGVPSIPRHPFLFRGVKQHPGLQYPLTSTSIFPLEPSIMAGYGKLRLSAPTVFAHRSASADRRGITSGAECPPSDNIFDEKIYKILPHQGKFRFP